MKFWWILEFLLGFGFIVFGWDTAKPETVQYLIIGCYFWLKCELTYMQSLKETK